MTTSPLSNAEIADRFELLADLLELDGAVVYRIQAYRKAAKSMRETPESVVRLSEQGRLPDLPGVGRTIADKVTELRETGSIAALDRLVARTPPGVVPLMRIPGIGPKTAKRIFTDLGLETFDDALEAARDGRIRDLPGLGEKTEQTIIAGAARATEGGRPRVSVAKLTPFAEKLAEEVRAVQGVRRCELAGSLRRGVETVKDIDLAVEADDPSAVADAFVEADWVAAVVLRGGAKVVAAAHDGTSVELRFAEPGCFGNLLQHLTGSAPHNIALREAAVRRKISVSELGVEHVADGRVVHCETEEEVYAELGLPYIPPELRENRGELAAAAAGTLPDLIEVDQIRGDLHAHTDWTDGKSTLEQMVNGALARGYSYLNITDHSPAVGFGMGLDAGRMRKQIERVRALAETVAPAFTLLVGCEVDILRDGSLDYSDELLAELDVVVASVHVSHRLSAAEQTKRICAALENPHVDILGHPTGRKIGLREAYALDVEAVIAKAAETGTVLEASAQANRLDLSDIHIRAALEAGVRIAINTDAHSAAGLDTIRFGVKNARRGWATAADVVNTRDWSELRTLLKDGAPARARAGRAR